LLKKFRKLTAGVLGGAAVAGVLMATAGCRITEKLPLVLDQERAAGQQARFLQAEAQLRSPDAEGRQQAAVALLSMDYQPALQAVLDAMEHAEDPAVRISMVRAAAFCRAHPCFEAVLSAIGAPQPDVRAEAALALSRFTEAGEVDAMMARAAAPATPSSQKQLLYGALGEGLAIRAVPVLLAGLQDEDPGSRVAAWEALRKIARRQLPLDVEQWRQWWSVNSSRTREDVLEEHYRGLAYELAARTAQVNDLVSQHNELLNLVSSPEAQTPKALLAALGSAHASVRQYSARRLAALDPQAVKGLKPDDRDCAVLRNALGDESPQVRQDVVKFVVRLEADCRDELVRKALDDEDPVVLTTALEAVRPGIGPDGVERLERLLSGSRSGEVREAAANALGKLGSQKSLPVLMAALDDPEENVRWFAVEGLHKLGAAQAVPRISEMLEKDASARVREIAADTLGDLGQPAGVPALLAALDDRSDRVREKAVSSLLDVATGSSDRMIVIAGGLSKKGLRDAAETVLTRVVEQYGNAEEMKSRLPDVYEQLAAVQKGQNEFSAAAGTYEKLDALTGGSPAVRRELVKCWIQGGEAARVPGVVEAWLAAAAPDRKAQVLDLGVDSAELLHSAGSAREAAALLELVTKVAGEQADEKLSSKIDRLRRRMSG